MPSLNLDCRLAKDLSANNLHMSYSCNISGFFPTNRSIQATRLPEGQRKGVIFLTHDGERYMQMTLS